MKTNYQMLEDLNKFTPENQGILTYEETRYLKVNLHLDTMDELGLRNLRDFAVMYYNAKVDSIKDTDIDEVFRLEDKMSGVVSVIDSVIFSMGEEV